MFPEDSFIHLHRSAAYLLLVDLGRHGGVAGSKWPTGIRQRATLCQAVVVAEL